MNNKFILESLAMDLKRVAVGNHRKSFGMANRFYEEALKRKNEVDTSTVKDYLRDILENIEKMTLESDMGENFTTHRIAKAVVEAFNWAKAR